MKQEQQTSTFAYIEWSSGLMADTLALLPGWYILPTNTIAPCQYRETDQRWEGKPVYEVQVKGQGPDVTVEGPRFYRDISSAQAALSRILQGYPRHCQAPMCRVTESLEPFMVYIHDAPYALFLCGGHGDEALQNVGRKEQWFTQLGKEERVRVSY